MTDTEPTTIIERLKSWHECLEEGDIREAIAHHDAVQEHILKHNDGMRLFRLAEIRPEPFIEWARMKKALKEQLGKSKEQRLADYEEARDAFADLAERAIDAKQTRDVIKLVSQAQPILQQLLLNAGALDERPETPEVQEQIVETKEEPSLVENSAPEPVPKPKKKRAKKPKPS